MKRLILIILFIVLPLTAFAETNVNSRHVLVLHSYHSTMEWVERINEAINDVLQPVANNYVIHMEYMDTKRIYSKEYLKSLKDVYREKYLAVKLDVVMSSDNNAFDFLRENRDELFGDVPVSFCGVNFFKDSDLIGLKNFTGTVESFDSYGTIKSAQRLYPKLKKVYVINDQLKTGIAWQNTIKEQLGNLKNVDVTYAPNLSMDELQKRVASLADDTVVLLGVYFKDRDGVYYTYKKSGQLIAQSSNVPVFCLLEHNLDKGVVGGNVIGGYYQGEAMSTIALRILRGEDASNIKVIKEGPTKFIFDFNELKKFHIDFLLLPENALVINQPVEEVLHNNSILHKLKASEVAYLQDKKVIRMCIDPAWMPYEAVDDNGDHIGMTSDFCKLFAQQLNIKFEVVKTKTWSESLQVARDRKCDILPLLMETETRAEYANFTQPYLSMPLAVATRPDITYIGEMSELFGKKIGIIKEYAFNDIFRKKYPQIDIVDVKNVEDGLEKVVNGDLFAFIDTIASIGYKLRTRFMGQVKISAKLEDKWNLGIGVRNDDDILLSIMRKAVNNLTREQKQEIINRWVSVKLEQVTSYRHLKQIFAVFVLLVFVSFFWILKVSQEKKRALESAENFEYLFNNSLEVMGLFQHGVCVKLNNVGVRVFGFDSEEDAIGTPTVDFMAPDSQEIAQKYMAETILEPYEANSIRQDGTIFPALIKGTYKKINGIPTRISSLIDLTDIKNKEIELESILNTIMESVLIIENGQYRSFNDQTVKMFGYSNKEELLSLGVLDIISEDTRHIVEEKLKQAEALPYQAKGKRKDGTTFPTLIHGQDVQLLNKTIRISSLLDISELKETELALELAKVKAEESSKIKSEFLANMSHEIRTPMNGILGMSHLVLQSPLNDKQRNYIEKIYTSADSLLRIINDILDFSKIEAGLLRLDKINFNIYKTVEAAIHNIELRVKEKNLRLKINYAIDNAGNLYGDSLRLLQVLTNLLSNAVKFTDTGEIVLNISSVGNDRYRFEIQDTGIGLTAEQQSKLFHSFSQGDGSTTRKYGGTGLGLTISKQLVELMNGEIWLESELAVGSKFSFEIDLEEAKGSFVSIINQVNLSTNKNLNIKNDLQILDGTKILLVEDNEINQEIIRGLLENSGIKIDIASNGKEGVDLFMRNSDYGLILMDLQMPIMDGYEATKIIRGKDKNIPIIALTANSMSEDVLKTQEAGMDKHLNKPIDVKSLYETLSDYLSQKVELTENATESTNDLEAIKFINIDTSVALRYLVGNKELYLDILNSFRKNYTNICFDSFDNDSLSREIHTLKGLSATIGAVELHKISKELDETQNKELLIRFCHELKLVTDELNLKLVDEEDDATVKSTQILTPLLRDEIFLELKNAVNSKKIKSCEPIIKKLETYQLTNEDADLFQEVKDLVKVFNFRDAILLLENI